jgi:hypothetical protein
LRTVSHMLVGCPSNRVPELTLSPRIALFGGRRPQTESGSIALAMVGTRRRHQTKDGGTVALCLRPRRETRRARPRYKAVLIQRSAQNCDGSASGPKVAKLQTDPELPER